MRARLALLLAAPLLLPAAPASADHRVTTTIHGARISGVHTAVCAVEGTTSVVQIRVTCSVGDVSQTVTTYGSRAASAVAGVPTAAVTQACAYVEATWLGISTDGRIYKARDTETVCAPILIDG